MPSTSRAKGRRRSTSLPDLAIEVVVSHSEKKALRAGAFLKIPEMWVLDIPRHRLTFYHLVRQRQAKGHLPAAAPKPGVPSADAGRGPGATRRPRDRRRRLPRKLPGLGAASPRPASTNRGRLITVSPSFRGSGRVGVTSHSRGNRLSSSSRPGPCPAHILSPLPFSPFVSFVCFVVTPIPLLPAGTPASPATSGRAALRATVPGLGMGGTEALLASLEEALSWSRPTCPLTGPSLAASLMLAQGSCELPPAKPRTRRSSVPLRGAFPDHHPLLVAPCHPSSRP